jgi:hypothetical protein
VSEPTESPTPSSAPRPTPRPVPKPRPGNADPVGTRATPSVTEETTQVNTDGTTSGTDEPGASATDTTAPETDRPSAREPNAGTEPQTITAPAAATAHEAAPSDAEPAAAEPAEPVTAEPAEPVAAEPVAAEPVTAEPVAAEPVEQPVSTAEAAATEPPTVTEAAASETTAPETLPAASPSRPSPAGAKPARAGKPGKSSGPRPPRRPGTGAPTTAVPRPPKPGPGPAAPPVHDAQEAAHAAAWGRVDSDGTVWVREAAGERVVGQFPDAGAKEALAFYVVRFLDLQAQVDLLEARLGQLAVKEIDHTLAALEESLIEPAAVGDLDGLRARLVDLKKSADERRAQAAAEREAARAQALTARTVIVEQAEELAEAEPERTQWRQAGEKLRALLDEWKEAQRHGPRVDKASEDALWKRFSQARATFDRGRRQYFAELEQKRGQAKATKEQIIEKAEALATSTDWGATAAAYRGLMEQWKAAGRAAPREDDALWERFRAAQDTFFAARNAAGTATDEEYAENLKAKLALLAEAESLVPIKDLNKTRAALRSIQERWDAIGKVPRGDVQRVEGRLRAVEQAVRDAQSTQWTKRNPEAQARTEGLAAQLEASIAGLEADLETAKAKGDKRAIDEAKSALSARKAWLAQVRRTASEIG